jgi:hypothetical protein
MAEYDLVCDSCGKALDPSDGVVSWTRDADRERGFALTHAACVPGEANERVETRRLVWPNEYLRFVTDRFGRAVADPAPLGAIVWALAPFVLRHDNPVEMDSMRAASFGQRLGVRPGEPGQPAHAREVESGK